jgi:hypothetical protein
MRAWHRILTCFENPLLVKKGAREHDFCWLTRSMGKGIIPLEPKIAQGIVVEHPAWEDLIVAENLTVRLEELDAYLGDLQGVGDDRSE